jgi:hypothetical protein
MFFRDGFTQGFQVRSLDIQVSGYAGCTGIAGGGKEFGNFRALG